MSAPFARTAAPFITKIQQLFSEDLAQGERLTAPGEQDPPQQTGQAVAVDRRGSPHAGPLRPSRQEAAGQWPSSLRPDRRLIRAPRLDPVRNSDPVGLFAKRGDRRIVSGGADPYIIFASWPQGFASFRAEADRGPRLCTEGIFRGYRCNSRACSPRCPRFRNACSDSLSALVAGYQHLVSQRPAQRMSCFAPMGKNSL